MERKNRRTGGVIKAAMPLIAAALLMGNSADRTQDVPRVSFSNAGHFGTPSYQSRNGKFKGYMRENRRFNSFKKKIR